LVNNEEKELDLSKLFPMSKRKNMSSDAENNENSENMASNKKQKKGILY
jgi:hypothetical protein